MKVSAIIAEYNPFHNGHLYHLNKSIELTNCDYVISYMSGDFLQRGIPALSNKYTRAKMALESGIDAVFEIPAIYATSSAEYFAAASVLSISSLGIVTDLCFGAECDDIILLSKIADILIEEPIEISTLIKSHLSAGISYPKARQLALTTFLNNKEIESILSEPNNILAIEYIKAIKKYKLDLNPIIIKRHAAMYHDTTLNSSISSASAIRKNVIESGSLDDIKNDVPKSTFDLMALEFNHTSPLILDDLTLFLQHALLTNKYNLSDFMDISLDLADRINNLYNEDLSYSEFTESLKTKQLTRTRINRCLLHLTLNNTKNELDSYINNGYVYYNRLLGFKKSSSSLLKHIRSNTNLPIMSKVPTDINLLNDIGRKMLLNDISCSTIYNQLVYNKFNQSIKNDYIHNLEII